jgi:formylmethanofuran dehydrogenase subunit B
MTDRIFPNIACTRCGCVCDDLRIHVQGDRISKADNACALAEPWFLAQNQFERPAAEENGIAVPLESALSTAAAILRAARAPIIYGLSRSTTEGQRAAVALAEACGAILDTTASLEHAQSLMALQQAGESTCTLGEVRQRADLVLYWGADPLTTHPRHLERVCPPNATIIVVDSICTQTADRAEEFVAIPKADNRRALEFLRHVVAGREPHGGAFEPAVAQQLHSLAGRMKACRFGVIFFGRGLTGNKNDHRTVESLLRLVTELNQHTRFYARRMRVLGDVAGADSVLTWQTGFPFAVNLQRGMPRYNPGEWSAPDVLSRGEADACLMLGSETTHDFPEVALAHLARIPVIAIDSLESEPPVKPAVRITTCVYGVHKPGTAYRMDEVPLPLRVLLPTQLPTDAEALNGIRERL